MFIIEQKESKKRRLVRRSQRYYWVIIDASNGEVLSCSEMLTKKQMLETSEKVYSHLAGSVLRKLQ